MIPAPIRFDRMRDALFGIFSDALGPDVTVKWSRDSVPRDRTKANMLVLTPAGGPTTQQNARGRYKVLSPLTVDITIDTATVGVLYSLYLNAHAYRYEAVGGDGPDDIRDALVADIVADTRSPFSAANGAGAGQFIVTGDATSAIWQLNFLPASLVTIVLGTETPTLVTERQALQTLTIGCFSKDMHLEDSAHDMAAKADAALRMQQYQLTLTEADVTVSTRGTVIPLSAIAGADWESRTSQDIVFGLTSVTSEPTNTIDSVDYSVTFKDLQGNVILVDQYQIS